MLVPTRWQALGWQHPVWDLVRYYCSFGNSTRDQQAWLTELQDKKRMKMGDSVELLLKPSHVRKFTDYLTDRKEMIGKAIDALRTEEEALAYCKAAGYAVATLKTRNQDHHQSSKAIIATATNIAEEVCRRKRISVVSNPQRRCVWCSKNGLHVTARNLDGAIPALVNPTLIWEIKEYWGQTSGGSKMSDAVYECNLVGRELRGFEAKTMLSRVQHVVLLDGKEQWLTRKSDLARFVDLCCQGMIDQLFIGRDLENEWRAFLLDHLAQVR